MIPIDWTYFDSDICRAYLSDRMKSAFIQISMLNVCYCKSRYFVVYNCKERKKEVEPFVASPMLNGVPRPFHSLLTMDYI